MLFQMREYIISKKEELFFVFSYEWNAIPNNIINNYSSFLAIGNICSQINGDSLNSHWKEVNKFHDQYRTNLFTIKNPIKRLIQQIEIKA